MKKIVTGKPRNIDKLINGMLQILEETGIPLESIGTRTQIRIAEAVLAVGDVRKSFQEAKSAEDGHFLTTRQIIEFENKYLAEKASPGSYDDIRRHHLILATKAGFVINSSALNTQSTNNPTRGYAFSSEFAALVRTFGTDNWKESLAAFKQRNEELKELLQRKRDLERIPVTLPSGAEIRLSAGEHNQLQKDIIEQFLPRFGFGAEVLYIGDTTDKFLVREEDKLAALRFFTLEHEELPDVIAYSESKNLLFMIEAVHSYGQMSEIRVDKLKAKLKDCTANLVFISAFENKTIFRKFSTEIAWESEVWIADAPDHMIHFNGYKFLEMHQ